MPQGISYMTLLDIYVLWCVFFLLLATFMHSLGGFLIFDCDLQNNCEYSVDWMDDDKCRVLDRWLLSVYTACWAVYNTSFGLRIFHLRRLAVPKEVAECFNEGKWAFCQEDRRAWHAFDQPAKR